MFIIARVLTLTLLKFHKRCYDWPMLINENRINGLQKHLPGAESPIQLQTTPIAINLYN